MTHAGPGRGVSADFAGGAGSPPRRCPDGTPELTEAPRLGATAAEGIPEGFRQARPGRVAPGGAEARSPSPARNESGRYRNPLEILKSHSVYTCPVPFDPVPHLVSPAHRDSQLHVHRSGLSSATPAARMTHTVEEIGDVVMV